MMVFPSASVRVSSRVKIIGLADGEKVLPIVPAAARLEFNTPPMQREDSNP